LHLEGRLHVIASGPARKAGVVPGTISAIAAGVLSALRFVALSALCLACAACQRQEGPKAYALAIRAEAPPGRPVPGAVVSFGGKQVGRTDERGSLLLSVRGAEGEHVPITVACPEGFLSPHDATDVVLHRLNDPGLKPEYDVACRPVRRSVVIVVRADHGAHLPVMYLGKEIARTDESGAAHALLEVPANDDFEIGLSTAEPGNERLRPQNPSMKFVGSDANDLKIFSVQFQLEPVMRRASAPPAPRMPVRIN
jgi:hypothetical protein